MKFDQSTARVTKEQVESYMLTKNLVDMHFSIKFDHEGPNYNIYSIVIAEDLSDWSIGLSKDIDSDEPEYLEILKQPTTFAHAWELMERGAMMACNNQPGVYRHENGVLFKSTELYGCEITTELTKGVWRLK